jgi:hypothetical protein
LVCVKSACFVVFDMSDAPQAACAAGALSGKGAAVTLLQVIATLVCYTCLGVCGQRACLVVFGASHAAKEAAGALSGQILLCPYYR